MHFSGVGLDLRERRGVWRCLLVLKRGMCVEAVELECVWKGNGSLIANWL